MGDQQEPENLSVVPNGANNSAEVILAQQLLDAYNYLLLLSIMEAKSFTWPSFSQLMLPMLMPQPPLRAIQYVPQQPQILVEEMEQAPKRSYARPRIYFTTDQIHFLEQQFERKRYPTTIEKQSIADALEVTFIRVNNWFATRRAKQRKRINEANLLLALSGNQED